MSHNQLIRRRVLTELRNLLTHLRHRADRRVTEHILHLSPLRSIHQDLRLIVSEMMPTATQEPPDHVPAGSEVLLLRVLFAFRRNHVHGRKSVRLIQLLRGLELLAVDRDGIAKCVRSEVRSKCVRQAERRCELSTKERGAQNVQRHMGAAAWNCVDALDQRLVGEVTAQLLHILREGIGRTRVTTQRAHRGLVRTRRATKPQLDAIRVQIRERAELFRDRQRCMIRQHDAAGAEGDALGFCSHGCDKNCRRRGRDGVHIVVLCVPNTLITSLFRCLRQIDGAL